MSRVAALLITAAAAQAQAPQWYELQKSFSAITIGIAFEDETTGWTSHTDGSSMPQIVKTSDGGLTWAPVKNNTFKYHSLIMGAAAEKGGGHDVGVTGIAGSSEYSTDGDTFHASVVTAFVSQDIKYNAGHLVITGGKGACIAELEGAVYICHKAPFQTQARYTSSPSKEVIYTTGGTWPSNSEVGADGLAARTDGGRHHALSRNVRLVVDDSGRRIELGTEQHVAAPNATNYTAELYKSGDGGKTWTSLFYDEGNFYFNGIDCIDDTNCIAVGEGFGEAGGEKGARVYQTTDGKTFKLIHTENTLGTESLMAAKMLSASEFWVGGTEKTGALLKPMMALHSTDSGKTWTNEGSHILGETITAWDWISTDLAYATTINAMQVSSLLKFTSTKPAPGPPGPAPPTPSGDFAQKDCTDANCSVGCQQHAFPIGQCLQVTGGGSAKISSCTTAGLVQNIYTSSDCTGTPKTTTADVDKCLKSSQGGYFENICGGGFARGNTLTLA